MTPGVVQDLPGRLATEVGFRFLSGPLAGQFFRVPGSGSLVLGRGSKAQIRVEDECLSLEHVSIALENERVFITDLNSDEGVFVNGKRVTCVQCEVNDTLSIGGSLARIELACDALTQDLAALPAHHSSTRVAVPVRGVRIPAPHVPPPSPPEEEGDVVEAVLDTAEAVEAAAEVEAAEEDAGADVDVDVDADVEFNDGSGDTNVAAHPRQSLVRLGEGGADVTTPGVPALVETSPSILEGELAEFTIGDVLQLAGGLRRMCTVQIQGAIEGTISIVAKKVVRCRIGKRVEGMKAMSRLFGLPEGTFVVRVLEREPPPDAGLPLPVEAACLEALTLADVANNWRRLFARSKIRKTRKALPLPEGDMLTLLERATSCSLDETLDGLPQADAVVLARLERLLRTGYIWLDRPPPR